MDKPNRTDSDLMTECEQLVADTIAPYLEGQSHVTAKTITLTANALAMALTDHGYDARLRLKFLKAAVQRWLRDPRTVGTHEIYIRAMAEAFGYEAELIVDPSPEVEARWVFRPGRVQ